MNENICYQKFLYSAKRATRLFHLRVYESFTPPPSTSPPRFFSRRERKRKRERGDKERAREKEREKKKERKSESESESES